MLPVVTAGSVISTVDGAHTAAGLVIVNVGFGFTVTTTAAVSLQPVQRTPLI